MSKQHFFGDIFFSLLVSLTTGWKWWKSSAYFLVALSPLSLVVEWLFLVLIQSLLSLLYHSSVCNWISECVCMKHHPVLEFRILASSSPRQAQAPPPLSSAGVAPPFSAQTFLCHLCSRSRWYFWPLCLVHAGSNPISNFLCNFEWIVSSFTIKRLHWTPELPFTS